MGQTGRFSPPSPMFCEWSKTADWYILHSKTCLSRRLKYAHIIPLQVLPQWWSSSLSPSSSAGSAPHHSLWSHWPHNRHLLLHKKITNTFSTYKNSCTGQSTLKLDFTQCSEIWLPCGSGWPETDPLQSRLMGWFERTEWFWSNWAINKRKQFRTEKLRLLWHSKQASTHEKEK